MRRDVRSEEYCLSHNLSHIPCDNYLIHSHAFYELYYCLSGDANFIYDGTEYAVKPHTLILVAPNVFHGIRVFSDAPYDRFTFHFTEELITPSRRSALLGCMPSEHTIHHEGAGNYVMMDVQSLGFEPLFQSVDRLSEMPSSWVEAMAPVVVESILMHLNLVRGDLRNNVESIPDYSGHQDMDMVLGWINRNLTRRITLDDLCREVHVSKSKLSQLFHRHLHTTVMEYIVRRRVSYAQQLLINGFSASQAANASGFGDYTSFYRSYLKQIGHPPAKDKRSTSANFGDLIMELELSDTRGGKQQKDIWDIHSNITVREPVDLQDP